MKRSRRRAFTLVEVLVVLSILTLLLSILLPVFGAARGKAREISCASNLRQIGQSFTMYMQDYDGRFPNALDPMDKSGVWGHVPSFSQDIPHLPMLHEALLPYSSKSVFCCPADTGFEKDDFAGAQMNAFPTCFEKFGTSYSYRTELAARRKHESEVAKPSIINLLTDPSGAWHGTLTPPVPRYNVLFADGHVKNQSREQVDEAWSTPLSSS